MPTTPNPAFEKQKQSPLAPDGLPWPPGYFDAPPKETFEQALARWGVRPNHYFKGRPVYTQKERDDPASKIAIPPEKPALETRWKAPFAGTRDGEGLLRGTQRLSQWKPFEVRLVNIRLGAREFYRPCLVVGVEDTLYARVVLLSTTDTSTPAAPVFEIDESHPDFAATGLEQTCYTLEPVQLIMQS